MLVVVFCCYFIKLHGFNKKKKTKNFGHLYLMKGSSELVADFCFLLSLLKFICNSEYIYSQYRNKKSMNAH